ncbi:MAG: hypothetical protein NXH95_17375 [Pseudomonadaceae bacterium]|nr:hypothetical protein [Pseudomonadaceae bacterium]
MKIKLTPQEHADLDEESQGTYTPLKKGDDVTGFVLTEAFEYGEERAASLHNALTAERDEKKTLKQQLAEAGGNSEELKRLRKENQINEAVAANDGIPKLLKNHLNSVFGEDEDGKLTPFEGGEPIKTEDGDTMTVSQYVAKMKEDPDFATMFYGKPRRGGGTPPATGGNNGSNVSRLLRRSQMDRKQKADYLGELRAQGLSSQQALDKYLRLPE